MRKLLLRKSWGDLVWFLKIWKSQKDRGEAFMSTTPQKQLTPSYLCTRCGTCVAACPKGIIKVSEDNFPYIDNQDLCTDCDVCRNVCPGIEVDFEEICKGIFRQTLYDPYVGYYKNIYVGYAIDENIRKNASSGGIVTSLLISALEQGLIDAAIVVKMNQDQPLLPEVVVADTVEKIKESMQSKYQPVPLNAILRKAEKYERLAVVGTPCQIQGLRKYEELNSELKKAIKYHIGLFCGFNMERDATLFLLRKLNIDVQEIKSIEYRGKGWPGGFAVTLINGSVRYVTKEEYSLLNLLFLPKIGLYCIDYTNELADISIGDAWFMEKEGEMGWSLVLTRTENGEALMNQAIDTHYIFSAKSGLEQVLSSHKFILSYKKIGAPIRMELLRGEKPQYISKNIILNYLPQHILNEKKQLMIWKHRGLIISLFKVLPFSIFKFVSKNIRRRKYEQR
jgi:coenzyme F420 hydrogenase subunit beta